MKITREKVNKVAHLARLRLIDEELTTITNQLDDILSYIDKFSELDTTHVKPTFCVLSKKNAFREDVVGKSLSQAEAIKEGPKQDGAMFVVPKII